MLQSSKENEFVSDIETSKSSIIKPEYSYSESYIPFYPSDIDELNIIGVNAMKVTELRSTGKISYNVYLSYISAGGNSCKIIFFILICILTQLSLSGGDLWIAYWYYINYEYFIDEKL